MVPKVNMQNVEKGREIKLWITGSQYTNATHSQKQYTSEQVVRNRRYNRLTSLSTQKFEYNFNRNAKHIKAKADYVSCDSFVNMSL
jgi:hypothetical protein